MDRETEDFAAKTIPHHAVGEWLMRPAKGNGEIGLFWRGQSDSFRCGGEIVSERGESAVTGSPWELAIVLGLSATVFLSVWHFVGQFFS